MFIWRDLRLLTLTAVNIKFIYNRPDIFPYFRRMLSISKYITGIEIEYNSIRIQSTTFNERRSLLTKLASKFQKLQAKYTKYLRPINVLIFNLTFDDITFTRNLFILVANEVTVVIGTLERSRWARARWSRRDRQTKAWLDPEVAEHGLPRS